MGRERERRRVEWAKGEKRWRYPRRDDADLGVDDFDETSPELEAVVLHSARCPSLVNEVDKCMPAPGE